MSSFVYFVAILLVSIVSADNACNAPAIANVSPDKFVNRTWYLQLIYQDTSFKQTCEIIKFIATSDPPISGQLYDADDNNNATYQWTNYEDGVVTYVLQSDSGDNITSMQLVFVFFNDGPEFQSYAASTCFGPTGGPPSDQPNFVTVASTKRNLSEQEINALQTQIKNTASNDNSKFYTINQSDCSKN